MKKVFSVLACVCALGLTGCSEPVVPSEQVDKLTLAFLDAKVYASGAVVCEPKKVAERAYVGCSNKSLDGQSKVSLWLYEDGIFKAVNGTARTFSEGRFSGNAAVGVLPVPIPVDIKIDEVMAAFKP